MGKVSTYPTSHLNWAGGLYIIRPDCWKFDHGLDSILIEDVKVPELDAFMDEPDAIVFFQFFGGFLCLSTTFLIIWNVTFP